MDDIDIFHQIIRIGNFDEVKMLLPHVDARTDDSQALRLASLYGHLEIVKLLIPVSDPKARESQSLSLAAWNGHLETVKLLLPVSDPKADGSDAIRVAAVNDHFDIIDLLYPVSDVENILKIIHEADITTKGALYLERLFKAEQDKKFLEDNLKIKPTPKKKRKM